MILGESFILEDKQMKFDYIIVGAGAAGCVLANRLSEDPNNKVCLIEAGPADNSILLKYPLVSFS